MINKSNLIGRAGEYRVASELLLRGFNPAIKSVDDGIDLILDMGTTVQVKSVSAKASKNAYYVTLATSRWSKGIQTKEKQSLKADFLIVWVIPEDKFFIIPREKIGSHIGVCVNPLPGKHYHEFLDNWKILHAQKEGATT